MRNKKTVNIKYLLETSPFAKMMEKSQSINQLNDQLQKIILPDLKHLYRIGRIDNDTLYIEVANAVVRQGLLFKQMQILSSVQQQYPQIKQLSIWINPQFHT